FKCLSCILKIGTNININTGFTQEYILIFHEPKDVHYRLLCYTRQIKTLDKKVVFLHITFTCTINIFQHITFTCTIILFTLITQNLKATAAILLVGPLENYKEIEALGTEDRNSMAETEIDEGDVNAAFYFAYLAVPYSPIDISDNTV
ncbi:hypothetical protein ACJX0J_030740, partial [Zea mays]